MEAFLILPVLAALVAWPVTRVVNRKAGWALALLPAILFLNLLNLSRYTAAGEVVERRIPWVPSLGVGLDLRLDGFSMLFALLITGIGALVVVYAGAYLKEKPWRTRARFYTLILLFMGAMLGAVLSDNLIALFVFWELTSLLSFLLIGFEGGSPTARRSASQSLLVTAGGGLALLAGILMLGAQFGTYSLAEITTHAGDLAPGGISGWVVLFVLLGAFTKSAQYPFYFWLPNAMQAPTPASAYLHSATMVKLGIYLLARFEPVLGEAPYFRTALVTVGAITMIVAGVQVLRAFSFKAVLAYSTIASLGILVMLVGLDGETTLVAMVGFIVAHALYKAALFFCAGTVIHATGHGDLRAMGGLARFLPLTAAAATLASLSMAGLPPFLGFISKEFLFEAQLESSWDALPLAIAVLVNAVMVGVAGVVSLRPFFMARSRTTEVHHGETAGLLLGPLLLSLLGLLFALSPEWLSSIVLEPAVLALQGRWTPVDISLWHGLTPMLALSGVVVLVGALILAFWTPLHRLMARFRPLDRFAGERGYEQGMALLQAMAEGTARAVRRADLRGDLSVLLWSVLALLAAGVAAGGIQLAPFAGFRPEVAGVLAIGMAGAVMATRSRSLLGALIAVGLVGFASALVFLLDGAPDLALTQFAVEALLVVLLAAVLLRLPLASPATRDAAARRRDLLLSAGFGAVVFLALQSMLAQPADQRLSDFYAAASYPLAFGRNVVNVILVDFRALDTMGETSVVGLAAVVVWALLRRAAPAAGAQREGGSSSIVFSRMGQLFFWALLGLSVVVLLRGHNEPGGGFVGGLMGALAFAVVTLSDGVEAGRRRLRLHPLVLVGAGMLAVVLSGLPGLLAGGDFLSHLWVEPALGGLSLKLGTTVLFDLGVYLVVLGGLLAFLFRLYGEPVPGEAPR
ncbi:DUF4040 domain-containing protein [Roseomonas sp. OT10]|uniref:hydrogen gas-evolving membrane-bound hydrogenase subunit E n=1 Tax=Roseomonas cutis TaxID=2897332 RepID=UPI001E3D3A6F|nr:hydrogen gas-evolving membrane-bound hydrogenase subunit E [Roseomonas sp. OT10]UFN47925.1 DUF4040 domain-containing protein [Roseomonas sp. OT10]